MRYGPLMLLWGGLLGLCGLEYGPLRAGTSPPRGVDKRPVVRPQSETSVRLLFAYAEHCPDYCSWYAEEPAGRSVRYATVDVGLPEPEVQGTEPPDRPVLLAQVEGRPAVVVGVIPGAVGLIEKRPPSYVPKWGPAARPLERLAGGDEEGFFVRFKTPVGGSEVVAKLFLVLVEPAKFDVPEEFRQDLPHLPPRIFATGFEVDVAGADPPPQVAFTVHPDDVKPVPRLPHTFVLQVGSVSYQVITHRETK